MNAPILSPLLEVRDLRIAFGGKEVVHGIDFHVAPGESPGTTPSSSAGLPLRCTPT